MGVLQEDARIAGPVVRSGDGAPSGTATNAVDDPVKRCPAAGHGVTLTGRELFDGCMARGLAVSQQASRCSLPATPSDLVNNKQ